MNNPKISVIVPIYKIEKYIDQCVQSIVDQTYSNLEIILVDDGSPDICPLKCDEWAKKDQRIKVIHKQNGGLSDARNAGIKAATGDYIGFVDGDDYIRNDMYKLLMDAIIANNSEISACGVLKIWDNGKEEPLTINGSRVLQKQDAIYALIAESYIKQPVWYKLYKKDLVINNYFPVGKLHEDILWSYRTIGSCTSIAIIDEMCYFYRQQDNSILGSNFSLKRLDAIDAMSECINYINGNFPEYLNIIKASFWFTLIYNAQRTLRDLKDENKTTGLKRIKTAIKFHPIKIKDLSSVQGKQKIWLAIAYISPILVARIRNFFKIGF